MSLARRSSGANVPLAYGGAGEFGDGGALEPGMGMESCPQVLVEIELRALHDESYTSPGRAAVA